MTTQYKQPTPGNSAAQFEQSRQTVESQLNTNLGGSRIDTLIIQPAPGTAEKPKTPTGNWILPYLADRSRQKSQLKKNLRDYTGTATGRRFPPLLCVVHGDECEHAHIPEHLLNELKENHRDFDAVHEYRLKLEPAGGADELRGAVAGCWS